MRRDEHIVRVTRKGISSIIGGMIVLSVVLTALTAMIFVSQQVDNYQTTASKMSQYDIQRFSENVVANYPGLIQPSGSSSCGSSTCYLYTMTLSNVGGLTNAGSSNQGISGGSGGGVGIQIVRIYINSTSSGCAFPNYCLLDPASNSAPYRFRMSDSFLNPGELNHNVLLWLPTSLGLLPNPAPPTPMNTVWIVTSRGRVFLFQWPFPPTGTALGGQSGAAVSTGVMKIAYQPASLGGYDSKNEGSGSNGYCHNEPSQPYPAPVGYKEVLTGITGVGVAGNSLTFVNPWITDTILQTVYPTNTPSTTLYIYATAINVVTSPITIKGGDLVITAAQSNPNSNSFFLGGSLLGIYYQGVFYAAGSSPSIQPSVPFYLIFKVTNWTHGIGNGAAGLVFTGTMSYTNQNQDQTYIGGEIVLDGLYDRTSCTSP